MTYEVLPGAPGDGVRARLPDEAKEPNEVFSSVHTLFSRQANTSL